MSRQTYALDWSDQAYPTIIPSQNAWDPEDADNRLTLTQARARLIAHHQSYIDHARNQIALIRELRASDITAEDTDA